jgi:hypothetical protein
VDTLMRIHPKGVVMLIAFAGLFATALDARLGIVALVAATIVDWLYIGAPLVRAERKSPVTRRR